MTMNIVISSEVVGDYITRARKITGWKPEGPDGKWTVLQKAVMAAIGLQSVRERWNQPGSSYSKANPEQAALAEADQLLDPEKMISVYKDRAFSPENINVKESDLPIPRKKEVFKYIEVLNNLESIKDSNE